MERNIFNCFIDKDHCSVKKLTAFIDCFLLFLIILSSPVVTGAPANAQLPWLHTEGRWITDEQGNITILRGINFGGYEIMTRFEETRFSDHREEDYQKIASMGFNLVRLPISWEFIEPTEGVFDGNYLSLIDSDISWAQTYGIYIIIDFHHWKWSKQFDYSGTPHGFPSWLFNDYPNSLEGKEQSQNDFWLGKAPNGAEPSPINPSMQDRMISVWKYLAGRYKNNPTVLGYDLFNEPPNGDLDTSVASNYLYNFYEKLIDEIKTVDSNHIFIYEPIGAKWGIEPRILNKSNVIFSPHIYPQYNSETIYGYSGNIEVLRTQFRGYFGQLPNWNIPVFLGEFSESESPFYSNKILWLNHIVDVANEFDVYWTYWVYTLVPRSRSLINTDRTEKKEKADVLDKPYPRVSSISPSEYSFDRSTKRFKVVFDGVGSVETEIYVPHRHYPNGFVVNSNSSQWSKDWDESSRILTVHAILESTVEITINPGSLPGEATITGKVIDTETGAVVVGATVTTNGYRVTTGSYGSYSFNAEFGTYTLTVTAEGYKVKIKSVDASEEKLYAVDFALTPIPSAKPSARIQILIGGTAILLVVGIVVFLAIRKKRKSV